MYLGNLHRQKIQYKRTYNCSPPSNTTQRSKIHYQVIGIGINNTNKSMWKQVVFSAPGGLRMGYIHITSNSVIVAILCIKKESVSPQFSDQFAKIHCNIFLFLSCQQDQNEKLYKNAMSIPLV